MSFKKNFFMLESINRILAINTGFIFVLMQKIRPSKMHISLV
jgi:hypothetical protein